jgi:hypothetical protein
MVAEARTDAEALYVCPEASCGRRLVVNWLRPSLTVLDQGDFWARHVSRAEGFQIDLVAG